MIMRRRNKRTSEREGEDRKGNGAGFDFHHVRFSSDIFCPKIECDSAKKKARNKSRVYINFGFRRESKRGRAERAIVMSIPEWE